MSIDRELGQLIADRETLANQAEASALKRYERIMHSKGDVAIVSIRDGNCGGCHLHIPPAVVHSAKNGPDIEMCDYCGRILYWQPD